MQKVNLKIVYKTKDTKTGAECSECGKFCKNPIWVGFEQEDGEIVESPYGSCCVKKLKNT